MQYFSIHIDQAGEGHGGQRSSKRMFPSTAILSAAIRGLSSYLAPCLMASSLFSRSMEYPIALVPSDQRGQGRPPTYLRCPVTHRVDKHCKLLGGPACSRSWLASRVGGAALDHRSLGSGLRDTSFCSWIVPGSSFASSLALLAGSQAAGQPSSRHLNSNTVYHPTCTVHGTKVRILFTIVPRPFLGNLGACTCTTCARTRIHTV